MIVMKFGGSSVKDAERIKNVAEIIRSRLDKKPVVVCSATGGTTDMLIDMANIAFKGRSTKENQDEIKEKHLSIIKDLQLDEDILDEIFVEMQKLMQRIETIKLTSSETLDHIQSFGERMSCRIVAAYLSKMDIQAMAHDAFDIGMITNPDFGNAEPLEYSSEIIEKHISEMDYVPVITGFIGKTTAGQITTLSRGGSDYTASIIGAAIKAREVQIWTDVDGVMTADPRIVKNAKTVDRLSFNEAAELAIFGAKVLHPKSLTPALKKNIAVRVLNTYNPGALGTLIELESEKTQDVIKAIACKKNISLLNLNSTRMLNAHGYLARIFDIFRDYQKSVDMISTSEVNISMTVNEPDNLDNIVKDLEGIADIKKEDKKAILCIVGEGMKDDRGIAGKVFSTIGEAGINVEMISQGASEINISFVVDEENADKALTALHQEFISAA